MIPFRVLMRHCPTNTQICQELTIGWQESSRSFPTGPLRKLGFSGVRGALPKLGVESPPLAQKSYVCSLHLLNRVRGSQRIPTTAN
jgi:hypothetical protein